MTTTMKHSVALAVLGLSGLIYGSQEAAAEQLAPAQCQTLYAGKSIDAGSVCVTNDRTHIHVTYATTGAWYLDDLHLFVGTSLSLMPATKTGNPKIGNFPYVIEDQDTQSHTFSIPLGDLGAQDPCSLPTSLAVAAHAAVVRRDASGIVYQTETGWANGTQMNVKGSWAMYFSYTTKCPQSEDPDPETLRCETAYAFGDQTFVDLGITNARWGWQITVPAGTSDSRPIYAGAGQNDLSKGTYVGDLVYSYDGAFLTVTYQMYGGWVMKKTHVYADDTSVTTTAPGRYGNQHELADTSGDSYALSVSGNPIYIVAHAEACTAN